MYIFTFYFLTKISRYTSIAHWNAARK